MTFMKSIQVCDDAGPTDFRSPCIRSCWASFLPASLVFVYLLFAFPIPIPNRFRQLLKYLQSPFQEFLPLNEVEALLRVDSDTFEDENTTGPQRALPSWRFSVLVFVGVVEALFWLSVGAYNVLGRVDNIWAGIRPCLISVSWTYAAIRVVTTPVATAPTDLFLIYIAHLAGGVLQCGGFIFDHTVYGTPWPPLSTLMTSSANLIAVLVVLIVVLEMPLGAPRKTARSTSTVSLATPEDNTSLFGWITFSWVYPLIRQGRITTLNEKDVWDLSPTMQSRVVLTKFNTINASSLLRKIWAANSLDIIIDFVGTVVSVVLGYAGPFFLKRILDLIDVKESTPESRSTAYIFACLAFLCSLLKAQADTQHLWYMRHACTRIRSELMASIYEKALKRKDFSGIIDKDQQKGSENKNVKGITNSDKKQDKKKAEQADDPKAGADVGKIVNLMAGDCTRVSNTVSGLYFIYGAPFEIIIAGTFLFQLLGWSALAGFVVILVGWPLNNYVMKRRIRMTKGLSTARDKRMSVLNELISAIKLIKYFAWEDRWIDRVMKARKVELDWMVKARLNSIMFVLIWSCTPIFVSIISFFVYVYLGNQLTVSTAFTSIALFGMIRHPLNAIPSWLVVIAQTGVALDRISVYLDEDEVTPQVSSLKRADVPLSASEDASSIVQGPEDGLGLRNASFRWNQVEEKLKDDVTGKKPTPSPWFSFFRSRRSRGGLIADDASAAATIVDAEVETNDRRFELRDISVMFPERALTIVTGRTASGKTALLLAVLGEMTLLPGGEIIMSKDTSRVDEFGNMQAISYAAQTPWLRHQSIKDNILFGFPYDEKRYEQVVECCALRPDLEMLDDGDETEIGARGVTLSGGQKARVALARAVYARTKYVLLDDPLSAVDSHTSRFLYERLLLGPLLANRTVVLVTHHVKLVLPGAHYLIRMLDGRIDTQGSTEQLRAEGILEEIVHDAIDESQERTTTEPIMGSPKGSDAETRSKKPRQLIKDEHREVGGVKCSYWTWGLLGLIITLNELLGISEKLWIKTWAQAYGDNADVRIMPSFGASESETPLSREYTDVYYSLSTSSIRNVVDWPSAVERPLFYVGVYASIGLAIALSTVLMSAVQYTGALRASRLLFEKLLVAVVRATFRFHDTTPQGRMLNRFQKDIRAIDSSLAGSLQSVNTTLAGFIASVLTIAVIFPWFLGPALIIGLAYRELAIGYLNTGRDLRRMESNTRSPIFSDFGELLEGIVTVRAFSAERRFLDGLHQKVDLTTKMWYNFWMTNRWLSINFDVISAIAVLVTTMFSISMLSNGAGLAGLSITSAMSFTSSVYWACRSWTTLELDLNSVERVIEYLDLPQEPPAVIESNRAPAHWPSSTSGSPLISVENLTVKYAPDLPAVIQDVSFSLKAGERVGLLGRTGSGKSTLATSFLRFVDPDEGRIVIDGIDISSIGVHDLRSRLTFIPQDATLFSGTIRDNLDPFNDHDDSECLDALRRVHLISTSPDVSYPESGRASTSQPASVYIVDRTPDSVSIAATDVDLKMTISLDTAVSAGGMNFSQGQRQLIAMARALLRRNLIIILDEATSSIDFDTDTEIQRAIREEFHNSLLLTVAHRIRTVIDYDRLIVLDKGQVVEFDTPWNLIRTNDGIFRGMCLQSGNFAELEAAAREKAESSAS